MKPKKHGNKKLNITERHLGRHSAWGMFWNASQKIEMDPRQASKQYLYVLIHELLHMALPETTEEGVIRIAKLVAKGVWQQKYRRIKD